MSNEHLSLPPNCTLDKGVYVVWRKCINGISERKSLGNLEKKGLKYIWTQYNKHVKSDIVPPVMSSHPLYGTYRAMISRCENPKATGYKHYGARGIKVCKRWRESFQRFVDDMVEKPSPIHSIDRIDNDGDYSPENCRWATPDIQSGNKRKVPKYKHNGLRRTIQQWSRMKRIPVAVIKERINNGWCMDDVLNTPPN